ncbi:MAG: hypothetical protein IKD69_06675 [Solobacterium sp.]|nr:hypothetical protein [Solobacterium sp.]
MQRSIRDIGWKLSYFCLAMNGRVMMTAGVKAYPGDVANQFFSGIGKAA